MNRTEANEKVLEIISNSEVEIVGMDLAKNVIPGMKENLVLRWPSNYMGENVWTNERCCNWSINL